MSDIVDTANATFAYWLNGQITQAAKQAQPNSVDTCEDCDKPIGAKRKQAVPSATRCIRCQNEFEQAKHKRMGRCY